MPCKRVTGQKTPNCIHHKRFHRGERERWEWRMKGEREVGVEDERREMWEWRRSGGRSGGEREREVGVEEERREEERWEWRRRGRRSRGGVKEECRRGGGRWRMRERKNGGWEDPPYTD
jgi:hypothetical protein